MSNGKGWLPGPPWRAGSSLPRPLPSIHSAPNQPDPHTRAKPEPAAEAPAEVVDDAPLVPATWSEPRLELGTDTLRVLITVSHHQKGGGVGKHLDLMAQGIRSAGHHVTQLYVDQIKTLPPCDAVISMAWFHGRPGPGRPGHGSLNGRWPELLRLADLAWRAKVPLVAHPAYDGAPGRSAWICAAAAELRSHHPFARLVSWSPGVLEDPALAGVRDSFVVAPQPVAIAPEAEPLRALGFEDREGICVGELGKLITAGYTHPLDLELLVRLISQRLPTVALAGYNYYLTATDAHHVPPSINVVQPGGERRPAGDRFQQWLGRFRVFLSLTKHESFSRVPVEAQALGVPVVYRPMPQSLTARLGLSAIPARTELELADAVAVAYQDKATWTALHQSGLHIAAAHTDELVGVHWQHLLRRLHREINENHRPGS